MVFEIMGVNLLEVIKKFEYKGVPIPITRKIAKQCLIGLDYLHRMCNIIHTDLKPENAILVLRDEELNEIANNGCLKDPKHKPSHVIDGTTKFADLALGTSFMKKYWVKKEEVAPEEEVNLPDKPEPLTYADLVPDYQSMNKNKKKKMRKKFAQELSEKNEALLKEWEAQKRKAQNSKPKPKAPEKEKAEE